MPTTRNHATPTSVFAKILNMLKSVPQEQLDDVTDCIDSSDVSHGDLWNRDGKQMTASENPIGANQGAHGAGADKFVQTYSDVTGTNASSPTAILGDMVARQERLEKAMSGIAACLAILLKAESDEPDADDEVGDEEDDTGETSKAEGPASMSLADAFSFLGPKLSKRAAAAAKAIETKAAKAKASAGIASPPSMTMTLPLAKSHQQSIQDRLDHDPNMGFAESLALRLQAQCLRMKAEGLPIDPHDARLTGWHGAAISQTQPVANRHS